MATRTEAIEIARVARQNSSGTDIRYEQLVNGKPENIPGYHVRFVTHRQALSEGKTLPSVVIGLWMNVIPFPMWMEDVTNVDGVMVRSFGFQPSQRAIAKAKKRFAKRLAAEVIPV